MRSTYFIITDAHRTAFGGMTSHELRRAEGTVQQQRWGTELADQLDAAALNTLNDAPTGWGWSVRIPDIAAPPSATWRSKAGSFTVRILRNARHALQINYSERFTRRIADLGDALERDGFTRLDDAPTDWNWVPGGRPAAPGAVPTL